MKRLTALFLCWILAGVAQAHTVDGANVPETLEFAGQKLSLNGAALRTRYLANVYVVALYLAQPAAQAEQVLASTAPRLITITMRREAESERIASALLASVAKNHERSEMNVLEDRLTRFKQIVPSMKRDDVLRLEFPASGETRVLINDRLAGALQGADFQQALMKIWLGRTPVDENMKRALLGRK